MTPALNCRLARATDAARIGLIEPTPDAVPWVAEVEAWALRDSWFWFRDPDNDARLLVGEHAETGELIAVGGHMRAAPSVRYIPGILVEHAFRARQGYGEAMLRSVITDARSSMPSVAVTWLVHVENEAMLQLSEKVGAVRMSGGTVIDSARHYARFHY